MAKLKKKKEKKEKKVKKEVVERSADELMADAKGYVKTQSKTISAYERIQSVLEATGSGRPARVVVTCSDPQENGNGKSVCEKTREIAIQDLFQVVRCIPCQKRSVQLYRNRLARKRREELASRRETSKKDSKKSSKKATKK